MTTDDTSGGDGGETTERHPREREGNATKARPSGRRARGRLLGAGDAPTAAGRAPAPPNTAGDAPDGIAPPASADTTVATSNYEEHDAGETAPLDARVRLKYVAKFTLHSRRIDAGGVQWDACEHEEVDERITGRKIFVLYGPGRYRAIFYKRSKGMKGANGLSRYSVIEFTIRPTLAAAAPAGGAPAGELPAPGHGGGAPVIVRTSSPAAVISQTERVVPNGFDSTAHWVFSQLDVARADREELTKLVRDAFAAIVSLSAKNAEAATANVALAATIAHNTHEMHKADIQTRTDNATRLVDMQMQLANALNSGGLVRALMPAAQRLADKIIPPGNAKPDQVSATLEKVDKDLPKLAAAADQLNSLQGQLRELGSFAAEVRPLLPALRAMHAGGAPAAAEAAPTGGDAIVVRDANAPPPPPPPSDVDV
jgi:hypothetical protein